MAELDDLQHVDAIEGWPVPEQAAQWFGAQSDERILLDAYRGGRMHHAWLIGGVRGSGKATLAYRFARFALAYPDPATAPDQDDLAVPESHPAARKIAAGAHPNILRLARPYDEKGKRFLSALSVDEVRRTIPFFGATAGEAGWRIAVIDTADDMNSNAANALLKILEEPPKNSLFLVLSHAPGRLLPTIRSRCRRLDLRPLHTDAIEAALAERAGADEAVIRFAAEAGQGSLRRAIRFLDDDMQALGAAFATFVGRLPGFDGATAHALGDRVAMRSADEAFEGFQDLVFDYLARRASGAPEPRNFPAVPSEVLAAPLATFAEVWEKLRQSTAETETFNLDRKQYVLNTLAMLARAVRM